MLKAAGVMLFFVATTVVPSVPVYAEKQPCDYGFELSAACITHRGLDEKVATYTRLLAEAQRRFGASYQIRLRVINHPVLGGYDAEAGDVFTDTVRDEDARNESFVVSVMWYFLKHQPEILFEHSALHEVAHIVNDDVPSYHRNGEGTERAEERTLLDLVGEARYRELLSAYVKYRNWGALEFETILRKVKDYVPVPAPSEIDEADVAAAAYLQKVDRNRERYLVYNGELHDVTARSVKTAMSAKVLWNPEKLMAVVRTGKPLVFIHNHPTDYTLARFPSGDDFGNAALVEFIVQREHPGLAVDFRVMQPGEEATSVSYGFKRPIIEKIRKNAADYQWAKSVVRGAALQHEMWRLELEQTYMNYRLSQDSFWDYLQYACPVDRKDPEICNTHPRYFLWPSDKFFLRYRGAVPR